MGPVAMRSIATGSLCVALPLRDARVRTGLKPLGLSHLLELSNLLA